MTQKRSKKATWSFMDPSIGSTSMDPIDRISMNLWESSPGADERGF